MRVLDLFPEFDSERQLVDEDIGTQSAEDQTWTKGPNTYLLHRAGSAYQLLDQTGKLVSSFKVPLRYIEAHLEDNGFRLSKSSTMSRRDPNWFKSTAGMAEGAGQQLSIDQLAAISDEALDKAYGYGRSSPGNTFGWQANLKSAAYAKQMIDAGVTDIEKISDAIHKGWNVTAKSFVQNPEQFADTEKLRAAGKLEAKLAQRAKLMNIGYSQLPDDEQEKDRVVARAMLSAVTGHDLNEFAVDGFGDSGDKRSKLLASVGRLIDGGNKVDWQVPSQMGHVTRVQNDGITMKRWKTPHSRMSFFLPMRDDSRDSKYTIKMVAPKHYAVVSAEQGVAEGFDSAAFDRHMDKLRAQKELEKTDPMRALVNKMHSDDAHAEKLKRKPKPDDERQITDPFHSSQSVNIGLEGVAEATEWHGSDTDREWYDEYKNAPVRVKVKNTSGMGGQPAGTYNVRSFTKTAPNNAEFTVTHQGGTMTGSLDLDKPKTYVDKNYDRKYAYDFYSGRMPITPRQAFNLMQVKKQPSNGQQGVAEAQNDYFKRRKDEEDRIAGTKAPAKRTPNQTDYEKKRKQQGNAK